MENEYVDVVIIGAGIAGLTACEQVKKRWSEQTHRGILIVYCSIEQWID